MKTRVNRKNFIIVVLCGVLLLVLAHTGHGVPCVFRLATGYKCPGCGITTMALALLKGDVRTAYSANPFLFVTLPLLAAEIAVLYFVPLRGFVKTLFQKILPVLYLVALILFGVFRNINA